MRRDYRWKYNTKRWKALRRRVLTDNPFCRMCLDGDGISVMADEVDHIVPVSDNENLFWDFDNLQGLCRDCHHQKTAAENSEYNLIRRTPDNMIDDARRWESRLEQEF